MNITQKTTAAILILLFIGCVTKNLYLIGIAEIITIVMIIVNLKNSKA
jgi:hypothetical protein